MVLAFKHCSTYVLGIKAKVINCVTFKIPFASLSGAACRFHDPSPAHYIKSNTENSLKIRL